MHALTILHDDAAALSAIALLAAQQLPGAQMTMGASFAPTPSEPAPEIDLDLVNTIAEIFDPQDTPVFRQFLRGVYECHDTLSMTQGDFSMRGGASAATRRLKNLPGKSIKTCDLWTTRRVHFKDGSYRGMAYITTPLGEAVLRRMRELGAI